MENSTKRFRVHNSGFREVEVRMGDHAFGVNLHTMKYVCNICQLSGIPCVHAMVGYMHMKFWKPTSQPPSLPLAERKMPRRPRKRRIKHPIDHAVTSMPPATLSGPSRSMLHLTPSGSSSSMPHPTPHRQYGSNTMPPPPTQSDSNTMPPNTHNEPFGSYAMPPPPTPGSNPSTSCKASASTTKTKETVL
ncbi:hypothetical protein Tco_0344188 [Tanacetum coccineum]